MSSFVQAQYPVKHLGVQRIQRGLSLLARSTQWSRASDGARGSVALLVVMAVSAVIVATMDVVDHHAQGQLLALWIILWLGIFAVAAMLAKPLRPVWQAVNQLLLQRRAQRRARALDAQLWSLAQHDNRLLSDLRCAQDRADQ